MEIEKKRKEEEEKEEKGGIKKQRQFTSTCHSSPSFSSFSCFICELSLNTFNEREKEEHLNECLDKLEGKQPQQTVEEEPTNPSSPHSFFSSTTTTTTNKNNQEKEKESYYGLRSEQYGCMICGLSLIGKSLIIRCQHIKRCSKIFGIGIRELLRMISPEKYEEILTQIDQNNLIKSQESFNRRDNVNNNNHNNTGNDFRSNSVEVIEILDDEDDNDFIEVIEEKKKQNIDTIQKQKQYKERVLQEIIIEPQKQNLNTVLLANARAKWGSGIGTTTTTLITPGTATNTMHPTSSRNNQFSYGQRSYRNRKASEPSSSSSSKHDGNEVVYAPDYKKIFAPPMTTPVIVDGFSFASSNLSDCYFLTHFHSDHYSGLTRNFDYGNIKNS